MRDRAAVSLREFRYPELYLADNANKVFEDRMNRKPSDAEEVAQNRDSSLEGSLFTRTISIFGPGLSTCVFPFSSGQ